MAFYWLSSCLVLGSVLLIQIDALGDKDENIVKNIDNIWKTNGVPKDLLQDGLKEVVVLATKEFPSGTVYSSTTTRKNKAGQHELVFNSINSNNEETETVRLAKENKPGSVLLTETNRNNLYVFNWKNDGIAANYQWIENGEGKSKFGIIKINPKSYNSGRLCEAVEVFEKSGLKIDQNRKLAIGRDANGKLQYININC